MADVTSEGDRLIKSWLLALSKVKRVETELCSARFILKSTEADLAKWLMPDDVQPGEKIAVWYGDSLIQVEVIHEKLGGPSVTIRKRGHKLEI
jgi:hypothetical protein